MSRNKGKLICPRCGKRARGLRPTPNGKDERCDYCIKKETRR